MKEKLDEERVDLLRELGNIGMGNAAASLSVMMQDEKINILVPEVSIVPLGDLPDFMGGADKEVVGIYVKVGGDLGLYMIFLIPVESALHLIKVITGGMADGLDEFGFSAISEVGNIVTAGYLNALSVLMDMVLVPEPLGVAVDLTESILGAILAESQIEEDFIVLVKTSFIAETASIEGFLTIIPEKDAFEVVYNKLLKGL